MKMLKKKPPKKNSESLSEYLNFHEYTFMLYKSLMLLKDRTERDKTTEDVREAGALCKKK